MAKRRPAAPAPDPGLSRIVGQLEAATSALAAQVAELRTAALAFREGLAAHRKECGQTLEAKLVRLHWILALLLVLLAGASNAGSLARLVIP